MEDGGWTSPNRGDPKRKGKQMHGNCELLPEASAGEGMGERKKGQAPGGLCWAS